jgi:sugar phosphate isomerase/epimerase
VDACRCGYCTNIHAGESWEQIFSNVRTHVPAVKRLVAPDVPFPLALRLSGRAAREIDAAAAAELLAWCSEEGCFVATLNGFPYGRFHGVPVKERVYLPDWRDPERARYTRRLAELLACWLPEGGGGSISSVPLGYRRALAPADVPGALRNLRSALEQLRRLADTTGREILLALEPEPGCLIETTDDAIRLFESLDLPEALSRHLGLCYDCCHQALQFEDPAASLERLAGAGIRIGQVQVSSALALKAPDLRLLAGFAEPTYLHQCVGRRPDGSLVRCDDLPEALELSAASGCEEWRVHFHVPVFLERAGGAGTTRPFLEQILPRLAPETPLEVETYTWDVLPPQLRTGTVTESIARELRWVRDRCAGPRVSGPAP